MSAKKGLARRIFGGRVGFALLLAVFSIFLAICVCIAMEPVAKWLTSFLRGA